VARTDLHIAPTAQRDRTQIVLVCAHTLARTEGFDGRAERRRCARLVLVSGLCRASKGIGKEIARQLAAAGFGLYTSRSGVLAWKGAVR